ncbi:unnamed protein product [Staurois parvus]|uniref:Uncharacterized protein n=1 Tax=Staurois parvus TaxID=386267 RepID=A0ABN9BX91_9NEOB|nr:unnamed protein product [Staurois parvus]
MPCPCTTSHCCYLQRHTLPCALSGLLTLLLGPYSVIGLLAKITASSIGAARSTIICPWAPRTWSRCCWATQCDLGPCTASLLPLCHVPL